MGSSAESAPKFKSFNPPSLPIFPQSLSPSYFLSLPPGLSPTELLDSPVLFSSSLVRFFSLFSLIFTFNILKSPLYRRSYLLRLPACCSIGSKTRIRHPMLFGRKTRSKIYGFLQNKGLEFLRAAPRKHTTRRDHWTTGTAGESTGRSR